MNNVYIRRTVPHDKGGFTDIFLPRGYLYYIKLLYVGQMVLLHPCITMCTAHSTPRLLRFNTYQSTEVVHCTDDCKHNDLCP